MTIATHDSQRGGRKRDRSKTEAVQPAHRREKGLWSFLTWSFFLSQAIAAEQAVAGSARVAQGGEDSSRTDSGAGEPIPVAFTPLEPVSAPDAQELAANAPSQALAPAPVLVHQAEPPAFAATREAHWSDGGPATQQAGTAVWNPGPAPQVVSIKQPVPEPALGEEPLNVLPDPPGDGGPGGDGPDLPDPIGEVLDPVLEPVVDILDPILDPVVDILGPVLNPVIDLVDGLVPPVVALVDGLLQPVVDVVQPVLNTVDHVVDGIVEPVLDPLIGLVHGVVPPVLGLVDGLLEPVAGVVQPVLSTVDHVLEPVLDTVTGTLDGVVEPVLGVVQDVVEPATAVVNSVITDVVQVFNPVIDGIVAPLIDVAGAVVQDATAGVEPVIDDAIAPTINVVADVAAPIIDTAGNVLGDVTDPITNLVDAATGTGEGLLGGLIGAGASAASESLGGLLGLDSGSDTAILVSAGVSSGQSLDFGAQVVLGDYEIFSSGTYTDYGLTLQAEQTGPANITTGVSLGTPGDLDALGLASGADSPEAPSSPSSLPIVSGIVEETGLRGLFDGLGL